MINYNQLNNTLKVAVVLAYAIGAIEIFAFVVGFIRAL